MEKTIKYICMVLLTAFIIFISSIPVSNAATSQLIIINSKNNTLNFYENNTLVRKFKCATGKSSTPTPQRKTTIVNKIKNKHICYYIYLYNSANTYLLLESNLLINFIKLKFVI